MNHTDEWRSAQLWGRTILQTAQASLLKYDTAVCLWHVCGWAAGLESKAQVLQQHKGDRAILLPKDLSPRTNVIAVSQ